MKDTVTRITFFVGGAWEAGWGGLRGGSHFVYLDFFFFFWLGQKLSHFSVYQVLPKSCANGSLKRKKKEKENVCICITARTLLCDSISTASVKGLIFV